MASKADDDLQPEKTEGFKVGEKKTVEEYAKLGKNNLPADHSIKSQLTRVLPTI